VISARQGLNLVFAGMLGAGYLALGHYVSVTDDPPVLGIIIGMIPLTVFAVLAVWKSANRFALLLVLCIVAGIFFTNLGYLQSHASWLYFIQHAGSMSILAVTFGATLSGPPHQALCSRIAILLHTGEASAAYIHYTWKVTAAWTAYFTVTAAFSVLLFFFASAQTWSVFANVLTPVFVALMFIGEYLIRRRVLPKSDHIGVIEIIKGYKKYSQPQKRP
jgi:uncharacterized membrane protein